MSSLLDRLGVFVEHRSGIWAQQTKGQRKPEWFDYDIKRASYDSLWDLILPCFYKTIDDAPWLILRDKVCEMGDTKFAQAINLILKSDRGIFQYREIRLKQPDGSIVVKKEPFPSRFDFGDVFTIWHREIVRGIHGSYRGLFDKIRPTFGYIPIYGGEPICVDGEYGGGIEEHCPGFKINEDKDRMYSSLHYPNNSLGHQVYPEDMEDDEGNDIPPTYEPENPNVHIRDFSDPQFLERYYIAWTFGAARMIIESYEEFGKMLNDSI